MFDQIASSLQKRENLATFAYYAAVVLLSAGAYFLLNRLGDGAVKVLLDFYKTAVELFFGNDLRFDSLRFCYVGHSFSIGKECLGLNVIVLLFFVCGVLSVKALFPRQRPLGILLSAAAAIVAGVFANVLRLISSIYFITFVKFETIHALLGIVIYLAVLIAFYWFFMQLKSEDASEEGDDAEQTI